jgi:hypothetical protein
MSVLVNTDSFQLAIPPIDPSTGQPVGAKRKTILRTDIPVNSIGLDQNDNIILLGDWSNPNNPALIMEQIGNTLVSSGWTTTGGLYGGGKIFAPFYFGTALHQVALAMYFPNIGYNFVLRGPINNYSTFVTELASALNGIANITGTFDPFLGQVITLQSVTTDPRYNSPYVISPSGQGISNLSGGPNAGVLSGNGIQYSSLVANKNSQIVTAITENSVRNITFTFGSGSANPQYTIFMGTVGGSVVPAGVVPSGGVQPSYTLISDAYQFAIVDDANTLDFSGAFGYGGNSLLACAPFVDISVMPTLKTSMFIVGPGTLKNNMTWNSPGTASFAINGDYVTFQGTFSSRNGLCTFIFPTTDPIWTSNKKPLTINPNVMAAQALGVESTIIGKIWNSLIITQAGWPVGAEQIIQGYYFHLISQQSGPEPCSLWMAFA